MTKPNRHERRKEKATEAAKPKEKKELTLAEKRKLIHSLRVRK